MGLPFNRKTKAYAAWRLAVYKRDCYTCQICGKKKCYLNAHHIKRVATHPWYALYVSNGITLCSKCHRAINGAEEKWEKFFFKITGGIRQVRKKRER